MPPDLGNMRATRTDAVLVQKPHPNHTLQGPGRPFRRVRDSPLKHVLFENARAELRHGVGKYRPARDHDGVLIR